MPYFDLIAEYDDLREEILESLDRDFACRATSCLRAAVSELEVRGIVGIFAIGEVWEVASS